jgi:hypothetical protein
MVITDKPDFLLIRLHILNGPQYHEHDAREAFVKVYETGKGRTWKPFAQSQTWIDLSDFCLEHGEFMFGWTDNFVPSRTINVGFRDPVAITKYKLHFG